MVMAMIENVKKLWQRIWYYGEDDVVLLRQLGGLYALLWLLLYIAYNSLEDTVVEHRDDCIVLKNPVLGDITLPFSTISQ